MEFSEVVRRRRMVRRYRDEPVDPAVVDRAVRHALRAPNAGFTQGWGFLVLDTPADVRRYWDVTARTESPDRWLEGMMRAPVVVVPCSSKRAYLDRYAEPDKGWTDRAEARWPVPYWHTDAAMAALLILQTAVDEGLGGCLFGVPLERLAALRTEFGIPGDFDPVGAVTLGHPETGGSPGSPARRARRPAEEMIHRGRWSQRGDDGGGHGDSPSD